MCMNDFVCDTRERDDMTVVESSTLLAIRADVDRQKKCICGGLVLEFKCYMETGSDGNFRTLYSYKNVL